MSSTPMINAMQNELASAVAGALQPGGWMMSAEAFTRLSKELFSMGITLRPYADFDGIATQAFLGVPIYNAPVGPGGLNCGWMLMDTELSALVIRRMKR